MADLKLGLERIRAAARDRDGFRAFVRWFSLLVLFLAIARRDHRIALEAQCHFQQLKHIRDIFNDQDWAISSSHNAIVAVFWMINKAHLS